MLFAEIEEMLVAAWRKEPGALEQLADALAEKGDAQWIRVVLGSLINVQFFVTINGVKVPVTEDALSR